jgi:hypothetical protein
VADFTKDELRAPLFKLAAKVRLYLPGLTWVPMLEKRRLEGRHHYLKIKLIGYPERRKTGSIAWGFRASLGPPSGKGKFSEIDITTTFFNMHKVCLKARDGLEDLVEAIITPMTDTGYRAPHWPSDLPSRHRAIWDYDNPSIRHCPDHGDFVTVGAEQARHRCPSIGCHRPCHWQGWLDTYKLRGKKR